VRERGLEGLVAKRGTSRYMEGTRTSAWLKVKVRCEQEFVVIGCTPGEGELAGHVGAFLLAVNEDGLGGRQLVYCGKVGTGGTVDEWDAIAAALTPADGPRALIDLRVLSVKERREVVWVEPTRVVQVAFQKWTPDGRLWHPSLLRVRDDKTADQVVREEVAA